MKSNEELNALAAGVESGKFEALTEDELAQVAGGYWDDCPGCPNYNHIRQCIKAKNRLQCPKGHRPNE